VRVSSAGINVAKEYILERFGQDYFVPRTHAKAGGAHECIRPTRAMDAAQLRSFAPELGAEHIKLYDLVFRTFIASQMKEAVVREVEAKVTALKKEERLKFFNEILEHGIDLIVDVPIKDLKEGVYEVKEKELKKRSKVPRYTYAQIIRMMKERGVGRPSTYAITIEKLQQRRYIYQRGGVLYATKLGIEVYEEIKKHKKMYAFVNEAYTRELEAIMDKVAAAELDYQKELAKLYEKIKKELYEDSL
jgi:reverse gyrase